MLDLFTLEEVVPITNFAQVQASDQMDPDSTPGNDTDNTPNEDDEDGATIIPVNESVTDLQLSKTADATSASSGDIVTYTIVVSNTGPAAATDVTVKDVLPSGVSFSSANATTGAYNELTGIWTIGSMANGATESLEISIIVGDILAPIANFAQIQTANPTDVDSTPGNDSDGTPNEDDEDEAVILPNDFCDNVTDGGEICGTETGCLPSYDPSLICSTTLPTGGTGTIEYIWLQSTVDEPYVAGSTHYYVIPGANMPTYDPDPISMTTYYIRCSRRSGCTNYIGESNRITKTIIDCGGLMGADLELSMTSSQTEFGVFEHVFYTLTLTNVGPEATTGVTVDAVVPTGMAFSGAVASKGIYSNYFGMWTVGDLASGESASLELDLFTTAADAPITFFAEVESSDESDPDSTPGNDVGQTADEDDEAVITITPSSGKTGQLNAKEGHLRLYPVPTKDLLHIEFGTAVNTPAQIRVFDASGKLVWHTTEATNFGMNNIQIPVRQLSDGLYMVSIHTADAVYSRRFTKIQR